MKQVYFMQIYIYIYMNFTNDVISILQNDESKNPPLKVFKRHWLDIWVTALETLHG